MLFSDSKGSNLDLPPAASCPCNAVFHTRNGCVGGARWCGLISEGGQQTLTVRVLLFTCSTQREHTELIT